jgi:RNA polymerase sigma factor (sigma-70 family)
MTGQEELIDACRLGDVSAYTKLYELHSRAVYNTIGRIIVHTAEAEDILQDSFLTAFQGIEKFRNTGGFRAWVKRIAINKSIDLLRKQKVRFVELESEFEIEDEATDEVDFELTMNKVTTAIDALPEGYRIIFNLHTIENLPHTEIAELLDMESGTVRTKYHRAKQKLLESLKEERLS